ncbi:hypothetical protein PAENI_07085 [Paenibacillus sp. B2(2019)]|nr:hypothetical protein PAENI_07085 [Paenibacillus sp. B2(2019)]
MGDQYKEIRSIVQEGLCYRLSSPEQTNFTSLQYVSQDGSESVVFVFRSAQHFGAPAFPVLLCGLKSTVMYRNAEKRRSTQRSRLDVARHSASLKGEIMTAH